MIRIRLGWTLILASGLAWTIASQSALAQRPPPSAAAPAEPEPAPPEEMVVTGSRLRDAAGKQAPVLQLSAESLERTGLLSVGDILQQQARTIIFNVDPPACYSCSLDGFNPATYEIPDVFGYLTAGYLVD
jgi:hypothetical protein